jgi:hypothetical protein
MKNSFTSTGISDAVLHLTRWIFPALLVGSMAIGCGPQAPQGGQAPAGPFGSQGPQGTPAPQGTPMPQGPQAPQAPSASQSGLVGQWRATLQTGAVTISIAANGQYLQEGTTTTGVQTMQSGPYQLTAPNTIHFTVTEWSPKSRIMMVPCGIPGDPTCNVRRVINYARPPGSTYAYTFNGPNSMTLNNETAQETDTFTRVAGQ